MRKTLVFFYHRFQLTGASLDEACANFREPLRSSRHIKLQQVRLCVQNLCITQVNTNAAATKCRADLNQCSPSPTPHIEESQLIVDWCDDVNTIDEVLCGICICLGQRVMTRLKQTYMQSVAILILCFVVILF